MDIRGSVRKVVISIMKYRLPVLMAMLFTEPRHQGFIWRQFLRHSTAYPECAFCLWPILPSETHDYCVQKALTVDGMVAYIKAAFERSSNEGWEAYQYCGATSTAEYDQIDFALIEDGLFKRCVECAFVMLASDSNTSCDDCRKHADSFLASNDSLRD